MTDPDSLRARLVGINHVALEVGDIDDAVEFYESIFEFELRGRSGSSAFLDMGDQFLALAERSGSHRDDKRHFGLVVDDPGTVERRLDELEIEPLSGPGLEFHDPWGNRVQIVAYEEIQLTKAAHVLDGMGLGALDKTDDALAELSEKGLEPNR